MAVLPFLRPYHFYHIRLPDATFYHFKAPYQVCRFTALLFLAPTSFPFYHFGPCQFKHLPFFHLSALQALAFYRAYHFWRPYWFLPPMIPPFSQPINEPIEESFKGPRGESLRHPLNYSTNQPMSETRNRPVSNRPTRPSIHPAINQFIYQRPTGRAIR